MEIDAASPLIPSQPGVAGDTGTIDRAQSDATRADNQAESQAGSLAALSIPVASRPEGSDPALWDTLTQAEQDFFSAMESIGTLSYGPSETSAPRVVPLGQRLDVRA